MTERSAVVIQIITAFFSDFLGGDRITQDKRSKYNVNLKDKESRTFEGVVYDSSGEMKMYRDFLLPQLEAGKITQIERQKEYVLQEAFEHNGVMIRPITYVADFVVTFACGQTVVYDFKGMPDPMSKMKRKLFWHLYPELNLQWVVYSKIDGGYVPYEVAQKGRRDRRKARKNKEKINDI